MSVSYFGNYLNIPHNSIHKLTQVITWPNNKNLKESEISHYLSSSISDMIKNNQSSISIQNHPDTNFDIINEEDSITNDLKSILLKMEELNRCNETDSKSVTSAKSSNDSPVRSVSNLSSCRNEETYQHDDDDSIDLWTMWGNLVKSWEIEMKKRPNCVKELVRRGIPQHFRTITWQLLAGADATSIHELYTDYLRHSSPYEKIILRDIPRTYPELEFFKDGGKGQQSLFNVIKAYAVHDHEVGYCQGSAFIVGLLLLQMPEEEAFAVFIKLMEKYGLRELYKPTMTQLGLCMFQLEYIIQEEMPDLYTHFNNMGFDTSMYASSWFLTLFTTTLPLELANRIMDLFLVDGIFAIFKVAIAILRQSRIDLLKLDMEGMLKYFQKEIKERYENDHDLLFAVAEQVTLNAKKIKKLEKEYLSKRTKEQEEAVELRRLRTENRLLRQRIDYLEHESSALADRLIRGQVDLAQQAENSLNITHELHTLRDINSDAHKRLEEAYETIRELSCKKNKDVEDACIQVDDISMIEHIHSLQNELIKSNNRNMDSDNVIKDLKNKVVELENSNKRLKEDSISTSETEAIQEELIRVKMREAEANLSLKEMRQKVNELQQYWNRYFNNKNDTTSPPMTPIINGKNDIYCNGTTTTTTGKGRFAKLTALIGSSTTNNNTIDEEHLNLRELEEKLLNLKLKEVENIGELKEMRQKIMELETQNHLCTNQIKILNDEIDKLKNDNNLTLNNQKNIENLLNNERKKFLNIENELKESNNKQKQKYLESLQQINELKLIISQLENKIAEKIANSKTRGESVISDMDDDSLVSNRSGSFVDSSSIASEEMSAFLAEVGSKKLIDTEVQ